MLYRRSSKTICILSPQCQRYPLCRDSKCETLTFSNGDPRGRRRIAELAKEGNSPYITCQNFQHALSKPHNFHEVAVNTRKLLLSGTFVACLCTLALSATHVNIVARSDSPTFTPTLSLGSTIGGEASSTPTPGGTTTGGTGNDSGSGALPVPLREINLSTMGIVDNDLRYVDVDDAGFIYAATLKGQIYILSAEGKLVSQWKSDQYLTDMKVDRVGNVYVSAGGTMTKYDQKGKVLLKFPRLGDARLAKFAFTSKENIVSVVNYLSPKTHGLTNALIYVDRQGKQVKVIDQFLKSEVDKSDVNPLFGADVESIAVGPDDDIYIVVNAMEEIIYHVSADGTLIDSFKVAVGPFSSAAVDAKSRFFIGRYGKIYVLDPSHQQMGIVDLGVASSYAIAAGKNGNIYVGFQRNASMPSAQGIITVLGWPAR